MSNVGLLYKIQAFYKARKSAVFSIDCPRNGLVKIWFTAPYTNAQLKFINTDDIEVTCSHLGSMIVQRGGRISATNAYTKRRWQFDEYEFLKEYMLENEYADPNEYVKELVQ